MEYVFLLGRILYGGLFVMSAMNHFRNAAMMTGYVKSKGVPAPNAAIMGSGVLMFVGGLSVVLGLRPGLGILILTVALVPITLIMHNFWADTDPMARLNNFINFQKNVALLGGAWMAVMIPEPWALSLG
jgi:putative oxidoreductase